MNRREALLATGAFVTAPDFSLHPQAVNSVERGFFSQDGNNIKIYHRSVSSPFKVIVIADTHLFRDDERGAPFQIYSGRMAKAYNQTKHFRTGTITHPEQCFTETLALAKQENVAFVALLGDIFSFPSEAAIAWADEQLKAVGLPYVYVAGNHDWHYEGLEGTLYELRKTWIDKRLRHFYQGGNPLMQVREVNGIRFVVFDNSYYEILPEQLAFFRKEVRQGKPIVLMMHIPLYAMGRNVGYGCGHPAWNAQSDRSFTVERRQRWPEKGHSHTTMQFYKEATTAPNVIVAFSGHIHEPTLDLINGLPSVVTDANAQGAFLKISFENEQR